MSYSKVPLIVDVVMMCYTIHSAASGLVLPCTLVVSFPARLSNSFLSVVLTICVRSEALYSPLEKLLGTVTRIASVAIRDVTACVLPLTELVNEEERQRIAKDAEIAKQLQEEIDTARQEQEKSDLEKSLELQKQLDEREEVVAEDDPAQVIDWSNPAMLRYPA
ncbi:hypothetical protein Tco_1236621 [Tanacetum coccineum]